MALNFSWQVFFNSDDFPVWVKVTWFVSLKVRNSNNVRKTSKYWVLKPVNPSCQVAVMLQVITDLWFFLSCRFEHVKVKMSGWISWWTGWIFMQLRWAFSYDEATSDVSWTEEILSWICPSRFVQTPQNVRLQKEIQIWGDVLSLMLILFWADGFILSLSNRDGSVQTPVNWASLGVQLLVRSGCFWHRCASSAHSTVWSPRWSCERGQIITETMSD